MQALSFAVHIPLVCFGVAFPATVMFVEGLYMRTGVPIMITGLTGSFMVISVNGWMNQPTGFSLLDGKVTDVHPLRALFNDNFWHEFVHMYLAGYVVVGFVVAAVYATAWLRGR